MEIDEYANDLQNKVSQLMFGLEHLKSIKAPPDRDRGLFFRLTGLGA
jgi:hypothetical protein